MISPDTAAVIEKFAASVKRASQAHSKDIRLDVIEAIALLAAITGVTARLALKEHEAQNPSSETMDGGQF